MLRRFFSTLGVAAVRWIDSYAGGTANDNEPARVDWMRSLPFIILHGMCLGVIWVGVSWIAVAVCVALYVVRMFAITGIYHRYFSHRTYKASRPVQFLMALLGASCVQRGALWWAAHHRHHHKYSDMPEDAHSPMRHGFWWSHIGWITAKRNFRTRLELIPDFAKYPELIFLDRFDTLVPVVLAVGTFFLGVWLQHLGFDTSGGQMLIWGFFISTTFLFHGTCTINSLSHLFGRQRFDAGDTSKNNWLLALVTLGEGWHNNHHHYQSTVRQGFYWYEIDISFYVLKAMSWVGLVSDLKPVPAKIYEQARELREQRKLAKAAGVALPGPANLPN
ncbi:MAG TPA: acyl-CoA desaturase [Planctomycetota bacterium]|nr:acyl-CoA desaturase [Planctomycetota bacterium]